MLKLAPQLGNTHYGDSIADLRSIGGLCVVLALKHQLLTDGTYWLNLPATSPDKKKSKFPFLALVEHTNWMDSAHYGGDHIVYCGDYVPANHEYFQLSEDELADRFIETLSTFNPDFKRDWIRKVWVFRAPYAQPIPFRGSERADPGAGNAAARRLLGEHESGLSVGSRDELLGRDGSPGRRDDDRAVIRRYDTLLAALQQVPRKSSTLLVAVDGCGGSGKSTFAHKLAALDSAVTIIHFDDFYLPSAERRPISGAAGSEYDLARLTAEVITPLRREQAARYQRYDWVEDRLAEAHTVPTGGIVIIEGVYALLADDYDYRVWVECPYELRLARGLARDGEAARSWWVDHWMPAEIRYIETESPADQVDLVVDGSVELEQEFSVLREGKMMTETIIEATAAHVQAQMSGEGSGHDWWHV